MNRRRDFKALEQRRLESAKLLARGVSKSEVARQLGVTRQSVAKWERLMAQAGPMALRRGTKQSLQAPSDHARELDRVLLAWGGDSS